jgi:hypothetical protein
MHVLKLTNADRLPYELLYHGKSVEDKEGGYRDKIHERFVDLFVP